MLCRLSNEAPQIFARVNFAYLPFGVGRGNGQSSDPSEPLTDWPGDCELRDRFLLLPNDNNTKSPPSLWLFNFARAHQALSNDSFLSTDWLRLSPLNCKAHALRFSLGANAQNPFCRQTNLCKLFKSKGFVNETINRTERASLKWIDRQIVHCSNDRTIGPGPISNNVAP